MATGPVSFNLGIIKRHWQKARFVVVGDSFNRALDARAGYEILNTWPLENITALQGGAYLSNEGVCRTNDLTGGTGGQFVDDSGNYAFNGTTDYFGLPLDKALEYAYDGTTSIPANGSMCLIYHVQAQHRPESFSPHGTFYSASDDLSVRLLYRAPATSSNLVDGDYTLRDRLATSTILLQDFKFTTHARRFHHLGEGDPDSAARGAPVDGHINAIYPDVTITNPNGANNNLQLLLIDEDNAGTSPNTSKYLALAGAVFQNETRIAAKGKGSYFQFLADNSWTIAGYGANAASTPGSEATVKRFTEAQLRHYLDATTIDVSQQPIVILNIDNEAASTAAEYIEQGRDMIEMWTAAFTAIGCPRPIFLFWNTHATTTSGIPFATAFERLSRIYPGRVSFHSYFNYSERNLLTGGTAANAWLTANGNFQFGSASAISLVSVNSGDGLDAGDLHWGQVEFAQHEAWVLGQEIAKAPITGRDRSAEQRVLGLR